MGKPGTQNIQGTLYQKEVQTSLSTRTPFKAALFPEVIEGFDILQCDQLCLPDSLL